MRLLGDKVETAALAEKGAGPFDKERGNLMLGEVRRIGQGYIEILLADVVERDAGRGEADQRVASEERLRRFLAEDRARGRTDRSHERANHADPARQHENPGQKAEALRRRDGGRRTAPRGAAPPVAPTTPRRFLPGGSPAGRGR